MIKFLKIPGRRKSWEHTNFWKTFLETGVEQFFLLFSVLLVEICSDSIIYTYSWYQKSWEPRIFKKNFRRGDIGQFAFLLFYGPGILIFSYPLKSWVPRIFETTFLDTNSEIVFTFVWKKTFFRCHNLHKFLVSKNSVVPRIFKKYFERLMLNNFFDSFLDQDFSWTTNFWYITDIRTSWFPRIFEKRF